MTWRASLAAAIFLLLLVSAILLMRRNEPPRIESAASNTAQESLPLETPPPPLGRAELIEASARAADAEARGVPAPPDLYQLAGRRFVLRLAFGCTVAAPASDPAPLQARYDAERETLRATVTPEVWTDAPFVRAAAGAAFEAAEGFWISRPWTRVAGCPPPAASEPTRAAGDPAPPSSGGRAREDAAATTPVAAPPETLGIVELFEPGSRRAARRNGRPYELVARLSREELDRGRGLRLVLEGRLAPLSARRPIVCRSEDADRPPLCLIGAEIERVAVTDGLGEHVFAEWRD